MPAELLSERVPDMQRKGRIRVGADADIVIFDPIKVSNRATFTKQMLSTGCEYVIVNGLVVIKQGNMLKGLFPGKEVRAKVVVQSN